MSFIPQVLGNSGAHLAPNKVTPAEGWARKRQGGSHTLHSGNESVYSIEVCTPRRTTLRRGRFLTPPQKAPEINSKACIIWSLAWQCLTPWFHTCSSITFWKDIASINLRSSQYCRLTQTLGCLLSLWPTHLWKMFIGDKLYTQFLLQEETYLIKNIYSLHSIPWKQI